MRLLLLGIAVALILVIIWLVEEIRADRSYRSEYRPTVPGPQDRLPPA